MNDGVVIPTITKLSTSVSVPHVSRYHKQKSGKECRQDGFRFRLNLVSYKHETNYRISHFLCLSGFLIIRPMSYG